MLFAATDDSGSGANIATDVATGSSSTNLNHASNSSSTSPTQPAAITKAAALASTFNPAAVAANVSAAVVPTLTVNPSTTGNRATGWFISIAIYKDNMYQQ